MNNRREIHPGHLIPFNPPTISIPKLLTNEQLKLIQAHFDALGELSPQKIKGAPIREIETLLWDSHQAIEQLLNHIKATKPEQKAGADG